MGGLALIQLVAGGVFYIYENAGQAHAVKIFRMLDVEGLAAAADEGGHALPLELAQFFHEIFKVGYADRAQFAFMPQSPGFAHGTFAAGAAGLGKAEVAILEFGAIGQQQGLRPCCQHLIKITVGGEDAVAVFNGYAVAGNGGFFHGHAQGNADVFRIHVGYGDMPLVEKVVDDAAEVLRIQGLAAQGSLKVKKGARGKR